MASAKRHSSVLCVCFLVSAGCYTCHVRSFLSVGWVTHLSFALASFWLVSVKWLPICCVPHLLLLACPMGPLTYLNISSWIRPNVAFLPCAPTSATSSVLLHQNFLVSASITLLSFSGIIRCPCSHFLFLPTESFKYGLVLSSVLCEDSYEWSSHVPPVEFPLRRLSCCGAYRSAVTFALINEA